MSTTLSDRLDLLPALAGSTGLQRQGHHMYKNAQTRMANEPKIRGLAFATHRVVLYLVLAGLIINTLIK